jgi:hypothetical protein
MRVVSSVLAAAGEVASGFGEEAPGFAVLLVFVAVLFEGGYGVDGNAYFASGFEDYCGRDEVPGGYGDDVGGEEVYVFDGIGLFD